VKRGECVGFNFPIGPIGPQVSKEAKTNGVIGRMPSLKRRNAGSITQVTMGGKPSQQERGTWANQRAIS